MSNVYDKPFCFNFLCNAYNQFHNILRLFDILQKFSFTKIEKMADYYL